MQLNKYIFIKLLIIYGLIAFLFSCAQQAQPLSGGKKDTIPPYIKKTFPSNNLTNISPNKIVLIINEYFTLKDVTKNFYSNIPILPKPKLKIKQKKLIIYLPQKLKDSTTYFFILNKLIADFHETNLLKNYQYVFSTYNQLDTFQISGKLIYAFTQKNVTQAIVGLYNPDSLPYNSLPLYTAFVDSAGGFTFKYIKQQNYKLIAFQDDNGNYLYDEQEKYIGFCDTLIYPYIINKTKIDTLDSGAVVINKINPKIKDTIKTDTIITTKITNYYPNNIIIKLFDDTKSEQKAYKVIREKNNFLKIFFLKPLINNFFEIKNLNDIEILNYSLIHKSYDSISVWIKDKNIYLQDTIKLKLTYYKNNFDKITDTFFIPQKIFNNDTLPLKLSLENNKIKINTSPKIISTNPILNFNQNKIHFYKIIDTITDDTREQNVQAIRTNYDTIVFIFSRPVKNINIDFKNNKSSGNLYFNQNRDTVICKLTELELIKQEIIRFTLNYDNLYFFDQYQNFEKEFSLEVKKLILEKISRPHQNNITIKFNKKIKKIEKLDIKNFSNNSFSYKIDFDKIIINLKDKKIINQDTLKLFLKIHDIEIDKKIFFFEDTITAIYKFDYQKITYSRRYQHSRVLLAFSKPLLDIPQIKLLSFSQTNKWYTLYTNSKKDTLNITITNNLVKRLKNMRFEVSYFDINHHKDTIYFKDTLNLEVNAIKNTNVEILGKEKKLQLLQPYKIKANYDTLNPLEVTISTNNLSSGNYKIFIDSAAFSDFGLETNDTINLPFSVLSTNDYSSLVYKISNIGFLEQNTQLDSNSYILQNGQIIIQLLNKDNIIEQLIINKNGTITNFSIVPDKYSIRIIYDKNKNAFWDTGDFKEKKQPEPIFLIEKEITFQKGKTETIKIDFKDLIKKYF